ATVTPLAGDVVSVPVGYAASFADKNVGTGKAVTVSGLQPGRCRCRQLHPASAGQPGGRHHPGDAGRVRPLR
ncbi:YDG domain-containing protein, partial [Pelomonas sp. KK5]|uniref:YDG domain-containing protein n=1 Tax=Pelomonas sp. KK5 TaxID=1855730 RepID=UPI001E3D9A6C